MRDNPSVNRSLADEAFDDIDHALGRPLWPLRETYRNHYATDPAGKKSRRFNRSLYWRLIGIRGEMAFWAVTDAGRQALADHLATLPKPDRGFAVTYLGFTTVVPAPNRGAAIYSHFLNVRDAISDLTFGDFVRHARVRLA